MALLRYGLYFIGISLLTLALAKLEVAFPGILRIHTFPVAGEILGTSEYSPLEMIQLGILAICGLLFASVARYCPSQRPIAFLFGGVALAFFIRELDYFLDRFVADNLWQVMLAVAVALVSAYTLRHRRRFRVAWARIWPSPGIAIIFCGSVILFGYSLAIGHEPLWMAIMGDHYVRAAKLAIEEFIELIGYFLWLIGTIEYHVQARATESKEPLPAAARRRASRRPKSAGRY